MPRRLFVQDSGEANRFADPAGCDDQTLDFCVVCQLLAHLQYEVALVGSVPDFRKELRNLGTLRLKPAGLQELT